MPVTAENPKSRYYIGPAAYGSVFISHLPDRIRDGPFELGKRLLAIAAKLPRLGN